MQEQGNLSINSENFLPIIKKWLYTDKDIFIRELVSNGCDAVTKLKKLVSLGEADWIPEDEAYQIQLTIDEEQKTLTISDNGIGMTDEEIKKYINQIAFSGASDFLAKFQEKTEQDNEIIGHFGLGFYSAFMVADRVVIDTLSYQKDAQPARWTCDGGIEYELTDGQRDSRGTAITLFLGADGEEFLNEYTLRQALRKYCSFMPVEIYLDVIRKPEEKAETDEASTEEPAPEIIEHEEEKKPEPLNDIHPLWLSSAKDLTAEDYNAFYHKVFADGNDPFFWIHLNMDYPFRLKGILYFPKLLSEMNAMDGEVKLYSNQVYIADNIKEVIPEFLLLLKGVIDCPDLPLNVSRSALQNDGYASKMSSYITKKVADKLNQLFKEERENYEKFFDDISVFIKFGCMKEEKLYDKIKGSILYRTTDGVHRTLEEYLEKNKDKNEKKVFYVTDENQQAQYVRLFQEQEMEAVILPSPIDKAFISYLEYAEKGNVSFLRIDADLSESLKKESAEKTEEEKKADETLNTELQNLFRGILQNEKLKVSAESLKAENVSAVILLSEESRRMQDMREAYRLQPEMAKLFGNVEAEETLVLNTSNQLVQLLLRLKNNEEKADKTKMVCEQIYDLALMGHKPLSPQEMTRFIERSNDILVKLLNTEKN